jgi:hypothetical protein
MKKVILTIAIISTLVACNNAPSTIESTSTDSTTVDTTSMDIDATIDTAVAF